MSFSKPTEVQAGIEKPSSPLAASCILPLPAFLCPPCLCSHLVSWIQDWPAWKLIPFQLKNEINERKKLSGRSVELSFLAEVCCKVGLQSIRYSARGKLQHLGWEDLGNGLRLNFSKFISAGAELGLQGELLETLLMLSVSVEHQGILSINI